MKTDMGTPHIRSQISGDPAIDELRNLPPLPGDHHSMNIRPGDPSGPWEEPRGSATPALPIPIKTSDGWTRDQVIVEGALKELENATPKRDRAR